MPGTEPSAQCVGEAVNGLSANKGLGWKEPTAILGLLALVVAVLAFSRDLTGFIWPNPDPTTTTAAPAPTPPTAEPKRSMTKKAFIAAANAACVRRVEQNAAIARSVGLTGRNDSLGVQMNYVERSLATADELVAKFSGLDRPPGDDERIDAMVTSLAESNVTMRSALDSYRRFGPQSPAFQEDLDKAAELEAKFNAAAKVYGMKECG
jgi:hypothetical protein